MSLQGFTAQVTCQQRDLDANTRPSLVLRSQEDLLFNITVTLAQLEVVCPTDTQSSYGSAFTDYGFEALLISHFRTNLNLSQR
jgi:hypothetical protein